MTDTKGLIKFDHSAALSVADREKQAEKALLGIYQLNISDAFVGESDAANTAKTLGNNWARFTSSTEDLASGAGVALINAGVITNLFLAYLGERKGKLSTRVDEPGLQQSVLTFVRIKLWDAKVNQGLLYSEEARINIPLIVAAKELRKFGHESTNRYGHMLRRDVQRARLGADLEDRIMAAIAKAHEDQDAKLRVLGKTLMNALSDQTQRYTELRDASQDSALLLANTCMGLTQETH